MPTNWEDFEAVEEPAIDWNEFEPEPPLANLAGQRMNLPRAIQGIRESRVGPITFGKEESEYQLEPGAALKNITQSPVMPEIYTPGVSYVPRMVKTPVSPFAPVEKPTYSADEGLVKPLLNLVPENPAFAPAVVRATSDPSIPPEQRARRIAQLEGVSDSMRDTVNFFTSPFGISTLGIGAIPKAAQSAIAAAFAVHMGSQVPELARELGNELGKPESERDQKKIANLITTAASTTGFSALAGAHALKPGVQRFQERREAFLGEPKYEIPLPIVAEETARLGTLPEYARVQAPPTFEQPPTGIITAPSGIPIEAPRTLPMTRKETARQAAIRQFNERLEKMRFKAPKPTVPEGPEIGMELTTQPTPGMREIKEPGSYDEFVSDLAGKVTPDMTVRQVQELYPGTFKRGEVLVNKEAAGELLSDAKKTAHPVDWMEQELNSGKRVPTEEAYNVGLKIRTIEDLERLLQMRERMYNGMREEIAKGNIMKASRIGFQTQMPQEAIEAATFIGEKSHPGLPNQRPLDVRNFPEVREWLRKNIDRFGLGEDATEIWNRQLQETAKPSKAPVAEAPKPEVPAEAVAPAVAPKVPTPTPAAEPSFLNVPRSKWTVGYLEGLGPVGRAPLIRQAIAALKDAGGKTKLAENATPQTLLKAVNEIMDLRAKQQAATPKPTQPTEEKVPVYHGEGGAEGAGLGGFSVSESQKYAAAFGPRQSVVEVPRAVLEKMKEEARQRGEPTNLILPEEYQNQMRPVEKPIEPPVSETSFITKEAVEAGKGKLTPEETDELGRLLTAEEFEMLDAAQSKRLAELRQKAQSPEVSPAPEVPPPAKPPEVTVPPTVPPEPSAPVRLPKAGEDLFKLEQRVPSIDAQRNEIIRILEVLEEEGKFGRIKERKIPESEYDNLSLRVANVLRKNWADTITLDQASLIKALRDRLGQIEQFKATGKPGPGMSWAEVPPPIKQQPPNAGAARLKNSFDKYQEKVINEEDLLDEVENTVSDYEDLFPESFKKSIADYRNELIDFRNEASPESTAKFLADVEEIVTGKRPETKPPVAETAPPVPETKPAPVETKGQYAREFKVGDLVTDRPGEINEIVKQKRASTLLKRISDGLEYEISWSGDTKSWTKTEAPVETKPVSAPEEPKWKGLTIDQIRKKLPVGFDASTARIEGDRVIAKEKPEYGGREMYVDIKKGEAEPVTPEVTEKPAEAKPDRGLYGSEDFELLSVKRGNVKAEIDKLIEENLNLEAEHTSLGKANAPEKKLTLNREKRTEVKRKISEKQDELRNIEGSIGLARMRSEAEAFKGKPVPAGTQNITNKILKTQKKDLMEQVDKAIKEAPEEGTEKITISVEGDGEFTLFNTKNSLKKFKGIADKQFPETVGGISEPGLPSGKGRAIPAAKDPKPEDIGKIAGEFVSDDKSRGPIQNSYSDGTQIIATDGRQLIRIVTDKAPGRPDAPVRLDDKGKVNPKAEGRFPNWTVIRDPKAELILGGMDTAELAHIAHQAKAFRDTAVDKDKRAMHGVEIYVNKDRTLGAKMDITGELYEHNVQEGALLAGTYNPDYISGAMNAARRLGNEKVDVYAHGGDTGPLGINGKNFEYIVMPMRIEKVAGRADAPKFAPVAGKAVHGKLPEGYGPIENPLDALTDQSKTAGGETYQTTVQGDTIRFDEIKTRSESSRSKGEPSTFEEKVAEIELSKLPEADKSQQAMIAAAIEPYTGKTGAKAIARALQTDLSNILERRRKMERDIQERKGEATKVMPPGPGAASPVEFEQRERRTKFQKSEAMDAIDDFYRNTEKGKEQLERHLEVGDDIKKIIDDEGWIIVSNMLSHYPKDPITYLRNREIDFGYPLKFQAAVLRVSGALNKFQPSEQTRNIIENWINDQLHVKEKNIIGPGAAASAEFAQRELEAGRTPPEPPKDTNPGVPIDGGDMPTPEIVRAKNDFNILNRFNSGQFAFYFGRLGEAAKAAWERMAIGEFRMREAIKRDIQTLVDEPLKLLPKEFRKEGGKAFFDVINGRQMDAIEAEFSGKPGGQVVIDQVRKVKTRLEEIRTTIRDIKRESYNAYLMGLEKEMLEKLYAENIFEDSMGKNKQGLADALTLDQFPDDWGIADGSYLPHLFFGQWKITAQVPGFETPQFITRAKTPAEAKAKIFELTQRNPEYKEANFTIEQDMMIPADMIRLGDGNFWRLMEKMKEQAQGELNPKEAIQGIIGRKASKQKWFGSLQHRQGFENYSKDYKQVMTAYLNGFQRWKELTAMNRSVQPLIEQVKREGRTNAAGRLNDILETLWGKPSQMTLDFDALIRGIPVVRDIVKPMALDRWSRMINTVVTNLTLRTLRFGVVNRLQPLQGLYPLIGEKTLIRAKMLQHSAEGRKLLDESGVSFDTGQYASEISGGSKVAKAVERLSGETSNQELAFLGMYLHGIEKGMDRGGAIRYAKLRGQLMTQFSPLIVDVPPIMEGPLGRVTFQFKRFPIKQIELLAQMAADRNYPALARYFAVMTLSGGIALMLRQAYADKERRLKIKRTLNKAVGEKQADYIFYGMPGLIGADLSGSLVLGDEPFGENFYEKLGRTVMGPGPSLAYETGKAITTPPREAMDATERLSAISRRIPSLRQIVELKDLIDGNVDVTSPDGEIKYRRKVRDVILGMGSFRSANEANIQMAVGAVIELKKEVAGLKNDYWVAMQSRDGAKINAARQAVKDFNESWPEVAITPAELERYFSGRKTNQPKTDVERAVGKKYRPLLPR